MANSLSLFFYCTSSVFIELNCAHCLFYCRSGTHIWVTLEIRETGSLASALHLRALLCATTNYLIRMHRRRHEDKGQNTFQVAINFTYLLIDFYFCVELDVFLPVFRLSLSSKLPAICFPALSLLSLSHSCCLLRVCLTDTQQPSLSSIIICKLRLRNLCGRISLLSWKLPGLFCTLITIILLAVQLVIN